MRGERAGGRKVGMEGEREELEREGFSREWEGRREGGIEEE